MGRAMTAHNGTAGKRQRDKLLELLQNAPFQEKHPLGPGAWVSLQEIIRLGIAQYGARIQELRRELEPKGWRIVNDTLWSELEQRKHSWYRLVSAVERKPKGGAQ
jgi:hypothetical protein